MVSETITLDKILGISEQLSSTDQLRLISLLSERLRSEMGREENPIDMLSLTGLGAELWQEIDIDAYLEQERASWEN
jgi:hypothetical protein